MPEACFKGYYNSQPISSDSIILRIASASGRSTQPRPRHPPLPAVGGEGHSPPQDCPRRSSEMGGRAQTSHPGTCWWGPAHRVVPIPERPELGPPHLRETAATQQCQEEDFGLRTSRNPGDPRVLGMKPLLRTKSVKTVLIFP